MQTNDTPVDMTKMTPADFGRIAQKLEELQGGPSGSWVTRVNAVEESLGLLQAMVDILRIELVELKSDKATRA